MTTTTVALSQVRTAYAHRCASRYTADPVSRQSWTAVSNGAATLGGFGEFSLIKKITADLAPGPDVLRLRPGVVDLYVVAPDNMSSGRSRTYTMESGHATLFLEARDSTTGALLGRALDKRATRDTGRVQISNSVTNLSDFKALFRQWAGISIKGFEELREHSPVPEDLKPGQKLN